MKTKYVLILGLLFISLLGCEKEDEKATPPEIPSFETMMVDFGEFSNVQNKKTGSLETTNNFAFAAGQVGFWNLMLTVSLAVPVTAFKLSFLNTPEKISDTKWQWSYVVTGLSASYNARLTGEISATQIKWEMYIEREGVDAYSEFKWFEGSSMLNGQEGQWILIHSDVYQEPVLQIDWKKEAEQIGEIKYTIINEQTAEGKNNVMNGSKLTYGLQDSYFDAFYTINYYDIWTQQMVDVDIEWSRTLYNGHVKAPHKFTDELWHCWDATRLDINCE